MNEMIPGVTHLQIDGEWYPLKSGKKKKLFLREKGNGFPFEMEIETRSEYFALCPSCSFREPRPLKCEGCGGYGLVPSTKVILRPGLLYFRPVKNGFESCVPKPAPEEKTKKTNE